MESQEQGTECNWMYYSWTRGHHAYKDVFQPEINQVLALQREPENAKDRYAVAVTGENGRIVGHIPLGLSKIASSFLNRDDHHGVAVVSGKRLNRGAGLGLEIPVIFKFYGKTNYLERLDTLIQSSQTARVALRSESEGIASEETGKNRPRKRKSIGNQQTIKMPHN